MSWHKILVHFGSIYNYQGFCGQKRDYEKKDSSLTPGGLRLCVNWHRLIYSLIQMYTFGGTGKCLVCLTVTITRII